MDLLTSHFPPGATDTIVLKTIILQVFSVCLGFWGEGFCGGGGGLRRTSDTSINTGSPLFSYNMTILPCHKHAGPTERLFI